MEKPTWRATALAVAAAALLSVASWDAHALALGRISVQSALGEPLRAEIDITQITPDELASFRASVASPDAFRAAGFEYSPALSNLQVTLQRRPDGRPFLLLTAPRPVNDPFIDLILETQWSSGRIVRDYTMLFDPPQLRQPATATAPVAPRVAPAAPVAQPAPRAAPATPTATAPAEPPRTAAAPAVRPAPAAVAPDGEAGTVTVQKGDVASRIALAHKPTTVSLDQMLVALLQANPDAFVAGNVNRLKSGAVLQIPNAEQAAQHPAREASRTIIAQSRDFNEFRRRLAEGLPAAAVPASERQASGKVQAEVQEKTAAPPSADKLTLSKGAVQGKTAAEDRIARERQAQDAATRLAELNKNIADLNRLQSSTAPAAPPVAAAASQSAPSAGASPAAAPAAATAPAAAGPQLPIAAPATVAATAPAASASAPTPAAVDPNAPAAAVATPASAAAATAAPAASGPAPIAAAPVAAPKPAPLLIEEPSLLDELLDNPLILAAGGGILALLAGLGLYRMRQRKKSPQVDSSFLESRLQPDSFFGGSGGQRVDTAEAAATGSSMVYSPSQLDAAGDVDPVAEADVYLAYGRDLQAEEILKEALRIAPSRVAIHSKLLEIYAKRRDVKAFEVTATAAYGLTRGEGLEWEHICELGRELDAANPLYRPGGQPSAAAGAVAGSAAGARTSNLDAPVTTSPDLDLDLDFSSGDDGSAAEGGAQQVGAAHLHSAPEPAGGVDLEFDVAHEAAAPDAPLGFELPTIKESPATEPARVAMEAPRAELQAAVAEAAAPDLALPDDAGLTFDLDAPPEASPAPVASAAVERAPADDKMIEFDLGGLSLDLDASAAAPAARAEEPLKTVILPAAAASAPAVDQDLLSTRGLEEDSGGDPLATKFALAQEFNAIGDPDGARSLAEEVLAEASGELRNRAQKFLAEIG